MVYIGLGFGGLDPVLPDLPERTGSAPDGIRTARFLIWLVQRIYTADTNTNVLPSMHVIGCAALTLACFDSEPLCTRHLQWVALPLGLLICASTVLVKQHSILDVFVAIPVSAVLYFIVYHRAVPQKAETRMNFLGKKAAENRAFFLTFPMQV